MGVFSLSALADRVRYLEKVQGLSREEAEKSAFGESGFEQMSDEMLNEYTKLLNDENNNSPLNNEEGLKGDNERLIDRKKAGSYETYDLNAQDAMQSTSEQSTGETQE